MKSLYPSPILCVPSKRWLIPRQTVPIKGSTDLDALPEIVPLISLCSNLQQVNQKPCTGGWCLTPRQSCPSSMATSPGHATEAASAAVPIWLPALQKAEHLPGAWGLWRSTPAGSKLRDCQSGTRYEGDILLLACTVVEAKELFPLH